MQIEFKIPEIIVDIETGESIKAKTAIKRRIPRQLNNDLASKLLKAAGPTAKTTMNSVVIGNFVL